MKSLRKYLAITLLTLYSVFNIVWPQLWFFAHHNYITKQIEQLAWSNNTCNEDSCCKTKHCMQDCNTKDFVIVSKFSKLTDDDSRDENIDIPTPLIFTLPNITTYLNTIYNFPKEYLYLNTYRESPEVGEFVGIIKLTI